MIDLKKNTQTNNGPKYPLLPPEEELVISGIAGIFPESDNMRHFQENLMSKKDLITDEERRWKLANSQIPIRSGNINNAEKFDSEFFEVPPKDAHVIDPQGRLLLERAFEAIVDAGINPTELRGRNIGVFIGACYCETEQIFIYQRAELKLPGVIGCHKGSIAHRISRYFGLRGPSFVIDTACSSSLYALEYAYRAIRDGTCDEALVGGVNLCLHPNVTWQFACLGVLSHDGTCKTFDEKANGYARSEAAAMLLLQRAKNAKRIYATVVHAKTNCDGYKEHGITFPSTTLQSALLEQCYRECGLSPTVLSYMEAHGTGTVVGDPEEVKAIDKVCCTGRNTPLRIGSVKSNLGHAEAASGICSIAKIIIAYESGLIPPNLHFHTPRKEITALTEGKLKVITEPTPWEGGYVGINSFGFGGANAHIILKSHVKEKIDNGVPKDKLPRLVVASGRTEEAITTILNDIKNRPLDAEYIRLFHDIFNSRIPGHVYRGYTVAGLKSSKATLRAVEKYDEVRKPVWFVFSGMGSQWPGMGKSLMEFPVFAKTVKRCHEILKPCGVDIINILTDENETIFDNILNCTLGITVMQIALVDILKSVGIVPDGIIGYSTGETVCAYADGCFTLEETIFTAYCQAMVCLESKIIPGSMAIVELGLKTLKDKCPTDIDIVGHNNTKSTTISGPTKSVEAFVNKLQKKNISAEELTGVRVPYHSRFMGPAGAKLLTSLKNILTQPKLRSNKWYSTSVPRNQWSMKEAQYSSAEYHTNNFLSPILFEQTTSLIPKRAVTIEIAPHSILETILENSVSQEMTNICLAHRNRDGIDCFLQALGNLYIAGSQPQLKNLYPDIEFPVSRKTPMISPLIKWQHSKDWFVYSYGMLERIEESVRVIEVTLNDESFDFMSGHVIDGRNLLPATGYINLVWDTIGKMAGREYLELPVVFEDVKFLRATTVSRNNTVKLTIMINKGTGNFSVSEDDTAVVTGTVRIPADVTREKIDVPEEMEDFEEESMTTRDVYKELRLRGYQYSGLFKGIVSSTVDGRKGKIAWENNWVTFTDNMLQILILAMDSRSLYVPTGIQKLVIDPALHLQKIRACTSEKTHLSVRGHKTLGVLISGGVEIRGIKANAIGRRRPAGEPVLEEYKFIAHHDRENMFLRDIIRLSIHLALENYPTTKVKTLELINETDPIDSLASPLFLEVLGDLPLIQPDTMIISNPKRFEEAKLSQSIKVTEMKKLPPTADALIASGYGLMSSERIELLKKLLSILKKNSFLLTREKNFDIDLSHIQKFGFAVVLEKRCEQETILLLKRNEIRKNISENFIVRVNNNEFSWLEKVKSIITNENGQNLNDMKLIVVGEKDFDSGALGFVNCLRREPGGEIVRCVLIQDPAAPEFSLDNPFYQEQLQKDLAINVLRPNNVWGSYRHVTLPPLEPKPVYHAWANQMTRGDLNSLCWLEGPITPDDGIQNLIRVIYAPLNFRDVMLTTGKLATEVVAKTRQLQECVVGFEFCGIDATGQRLMGISQRCLANMCIVDRDLCWEVPNKWTLEEAATIPCVYGTCYYALYLNGKMKKGDKVLIHAGSGGVGQAAIHLALHEGCEVFTTVGTPEKRRFIRETFPMINDDHIGNSRDTSFEQMIFQQTKGRGVDIVLNSLAEEKLQASVRCLAPGGRFLEIGKFDLAANNTLGMEVFAKGISFHGVMLDNLFGAPAEKKRYLRDLLYEGLRSEAVKPLTRTIFSKDELEAAFRFMGAGKHIGKVMIKLNNEEGPYDVPMNAYPRYNCLKGKSYLILGGLGGFGLELADWLILRGAQNLILTSRNGMKNGYQKMRVALWKSYGVNVTIVVDKDASKREDCEYIIKTAEKLGPIDAIFNLAVVLKDSICQNQTAETFEESFRAKAWATKQLDELSRELCPHLRHFVIFSSVSCGRGNAGQTNYGMSNSVMERICERRVVDGFPALAVQWGAVGDVGLVADMQDEDKELVIGGTLPQKIVSCLKELDVFMQQNKTIVSSMVVAEKRVGTTGAANMVETVMNIMGVKDLRTISTQTTLAELGMDSMMTVEIKQTLEREFDVLLTAQDARSLNFAKLIEMDEKQKNKTKFQTQDAENTFGFKLIMKLLGGKSLTHSGCVEIKSTSNNGRRELFVIPGFEGNASIFTPMSVQLKRRTVCIQLGLDINHQRTIKDMAEYTYQQILNNCKNGKAFDVVGYSFGALISIEVVRKLEAAGWNGRLILIDGSPQNMNAIIKDQLCNSNSAELFEDEVLLSMIDMVAPQLRADIAPTLEQFTTWEEKMGLIVSKKVIEPAILSLTDAELRDYCSILYNRANVIRDYCATDSPPIQTPITLLKPTIPSSSLNEEDYGLKNVTEGEIKIYYIAGTHATMIDNPTLITFFNDEAKEDKKYLKSDVVDQGQVST